MLLNHLYILGALFFLLYVSQWFVMGSELFYLVCLFQVEFDLNQSMDKVKRRNYKECKNEKLDHLLMWILLNRYKFAVSPPSQQQQQQNHHTVSGAQGSMNSSHPSRSVSIDAQQPNPLISTGHITR